MIAKPVPRVVERAEKRRLRQRMQRDVYWLVTARDGRKCRACAASADPAALDSLKRGHHHHVRFRSRGGDNSTVNLVLLCALCHSAVHVTRELTITGNADSTLTMARDGRICHG